MTEQQSRLARRQAKEQEERTTEEQEAKRQKKRKERIRLIPIWLRMILAIVLIGGCLILGIIVGYSVLGEGDPSDALKPETWYHILDIMQGR